ncbi:hypothetical protein WJX74_003422 [Apatococcus lobatus]|uniref:Uncharacterized protein n=1 Tax=Apatococcus lobatus TaxID=904363 RepID=A0AAW1QX07_9CHLO
MSTSGTLPLVPGPPSPTTTSLPVAAAIVGGSAAALALVILLTWLTRREGAWAQRHRRHAERAVTLRRELQGRIANAGATETEVQPADCKPDLKRPTPFLVLNPGSEMLFGLKEVIVEPSEKDKEDVTAKEGTELDTTSPVRAASDTQHCLSAAAEAEPSLAATVNANDSSAAAWACKYSLAKSKSFLGSISAGSSSGSITNMNDCSGHF